ncbi:hypothetical protein L9F63_000594, partial [Diploptera punctata]
ICREFARELHHMLIFIFILPMYNAIVLLFNCNIIVFSLCNCNVIAFFVVYFSLHYNFNRVKRYNLHVVKFCRPANRTIT